MSITSWVNYQQAKQSLISETEDKLYQSSESSHKFITNWFAYRFMDINAQARGQVNIQLMSKIISGWHNSNKPLKEYVNSYDWLLRVDGLQDDLINLSNNYDYIYDLFLIDTKGNILFTTKNEQDLGDNLINGSLSNSKFAKTVYSTIQSGSILFSDIERYQPSGNQLSGFLTAPIIDDNGDIIGVFAMQLLLDRIFERMMHQDDINSSNTHYLVATDGLLRTPVLHDLQSILKQKINTEQFKLWLSEHNTGEQPDDQKEVVFEYVGPSGNQVFGVHQSVMINNVRWVLISEVDSEEVFKTSEEMATTVLIVLLLSIIVITIIVIIQAKRITTPLKKLSQASHNVALGKENQQVDIEVNNEIGQLASEFNNMLNKQKQTELQIKQSNEQLQGALTELSSQQYALDQHAIVAITDAAGTISFVNEKFCEISGYQHDQLIGENHRILNSGYHSKSFFTEMFQIISAGQVWHGQICNRNQNGELYWVETTITPYKDEHGTVQQYIAIRTDITEQKDFELQQQNWLKVAALKLAITNSFSHRKVFNEQLSEGLSHLLKLPGFKLKEKACLFILDKSKQSFEVVIKEGEFATNESSIDKELFTLCEQGIHSQGVTIDSFCNMTVCAEHEAHGHYVVPLTSELDDSKLHYNNLEGVILLFSDKNSGLADDQVQLLSEVATIFTNAILGNKANGLLREASEVAQQNDQLKGEFLASMSHEIRTPMNGVLGMLGLLLNGDLNAAQTHKASLAKSSAESLLSLINDILDFSKVEAGKMELEIIDFNLREMLGELSESMALRAQEKGVEIILDVTAVEYSMVKGDPGRIRQITTNLISNAIKFTENGEIKVTVEMQDKGQGNLLLQCHITDSGIGIPKEKIDNLFEIFTQVDASTTRKYGGTGLGLAICKKLSQLMGGDVTASSELGKGSTFSFTAQLQSSQQSQRVLPSVDISKLNLLIVDDNSTNLEVLRGQLEHWGANVTEAKDGVQALDICKQYLASEQQIFDVALLDMQMPEMDGAELGKRLRENSQFDDMKLVIMTSISTQSESKFFANLGFDGYFPKPATTSDLFQALSVVVDNKSQLKEATPIVTHDYLASLSHGKPSNSPLEFDKSSVKILLVEDNKVNQMVATGILEVYGFTADIAEDGEKAITCLNNSDQEYPYQLIFMDCQMPVMDGYQTTKNIRNGMAGERYKTIPIIAMTANAMEGDRDKCLQVGMDDYIGKPIEPAILEKKLYQWLAKHVEISALGEPDSTQSATQALIGWDQEAALQRLVNKKSLLIMLINTFIEEIPAKFDQLTYAISNEDKKEVALLAHTIKGAAANLSAIKLAHYCFELEKIGKSEQAEVQDYQQLLEPLKQSYTELFDEFHAYLENDKSVNPQENSLSIGQAIQFLTTLNSRLAESDYIESEEIAPLIESGFVAAVNEPLKELQQLITLFDLSGAQQLTERVIVLLQNIEKGNN